MCVKLGSSLLTMTDAPVPIVEKQSGFLRRIWAHKISFFVHRPELG